MATLPSEVQPGDLITSEFMNAILSELVSLRSALDQLGTPSGSVAVPDLFGRTLSEARAILLQPARQLALGNVIDAAGTLIDPLAQANRLLRVLAQVPIAGAYVQPATAVNLVVSAAAGGTTPETKPPTITDLRTPAGTVATRFRVDEGMVITGANFDATPANNAVSFGGIGVTPLANANDPTRRLVLVVPRGIPGAPTAPGQADLPGVQIVVTTPGGQAATTCTIAAPSEIPPPRIDDIQPAFAGLGETVTITGSGFSATAAQNAVSFGGTSGTVLSGGTTSLSVRVPRSMPGLNQQGDNQLVDVTVTVNGVPAAAPFQITVFHP